MYGDLAQDLRTIFSRFGKILSCEVIRDFKTGDSLQYAFIEFDKEEACIEAYFKMGNVLIDDRRIHVDFSQSVARTNFRVPPSVFFFFSGVRGLQFAITLTAGV